MARIFRPPQLKVALRKASNKSPQSLTVQGPHALLTQIPFVYIDPFKTRYQEASHGVMPLTPLSLQKLQLLHPKTKISAAAVAWYDLEKRRREQLQSVIYSSAPPRYNLYSFQRYGVSFLLGTTLWYSQKMLQPRALLADDPRLGKTIQALVVLEQVMPITALILCLKPLTEYWAEKVLQWTTYTPRVVINVPTAKRREILLQRSAAGREIMITNWETLRNIVLPSKHFKFIIGDETHIVRNRKAQVTKAFSRLRPQSLLLLTATPVERGVQDYYTSLHMLRPYEFNSYWRFVGWYAQMHFNGFANEIVGTQNEDLLRDQLFPLALRRQAVDVMNMPEKIFDSIYCPLTPAQEKMYKKLEKEFLITLTTEILPISNQLARTVRLRQLSIMPQRFDLKQVSPKIEALISWIQTNAVKNIQLVVFTSFRDAGAEITRQLVANKITAQSFFGGDETPRDFLNQKIQVLVTNPGFAGVGTDYSNADVIVYMDVPVSATVLRQSQERTTRIGLKRSRLIITMISTEIDRQLAAILKNKQNLIQLIDIYDAVSAALKLEPI